MGEIVTFYSFKGGVGRSMAVANVAVLLSQYGYKVLVVDWDIEAPGLEFFFKDYFSDLNLEAVIQKEGIVDILHYAFDEKLDYLKSEKLSDIIIDVSIPASPETLHFISSGRRDQHYFTKVRKLNLETFYTDKKGGNFIENLRNDWKQKYDFVLLDSRTGITDIGGICTIQLPDILVLFFAATEQSFKGVIDIAQKTVLARQKLPFNRLSLITVPIPSKFDSTDEFRIGQQWLNRFSDELEEIYANWLPTNVKRRSFLELTKIPYIPYFSFGEKIPVLEQGTTDPTGLGYAYETLSAMIAKKFERVDLLIQNRSNINELALKKRIKRLKPNPYHNRNMIKRPEDFLNRREELQQIYELLHNAQNISIVGGHQIGKSSLLYCMQFPEIQKTFQVQMSFSESRFVYFDLQTKHDLSWNEFLSSLLHDTDPDNSFPGEVSFRDFELHISGILDNKFDKIILLLDHFDFIENDPELNENFFNKFRSLSSQYPVALVTASNNYLRNLPYAGDTRFNNTFQIINLKLMPYEDARQIIVHPSQGSGVLFDEDDIENILNFCGTHPYYIQLMCWHIYEVKKKRKKNNEKKLTDDDKRHIYDSMLQYAKTNFDNDLTKDEISYLKSEPTQNYPEAIRYRLENIGFVKTASDGKPEPFGTILKVYLDKTQNHLIKEEPESQKVSRPDEDLIVAEHESSLKTVEKNIKCFSWLHLTDLHIGMREQQWILSGAKDIFFEDLKVLHDKCGPWDLVLFTGDITQQGKAVEFSKVEELLNQLWEYFDKLGSNPKLLAVPGNHDLVRPKTEDPLIRPSLFGFRHWINEQEVQKDFWSEVKSPYRQVVIKAFENYTTWWGYQSLKPKKLNNGILPGDFSVSIEKDGAKLGIVGLNTAFLQLTSDNYKGKLALHTCQFNEVCGGNGPSWVKQHDACLLMTHHPVAWLNPDSQQHLDGEIIAHGRFAVHLCGHLHEVAYRGISEGGIEGRLTLQGRSLFGLEYFDQNEMRSHGYTSGRIELHENQGKLLFWPREARLQGRQKKIVPDYSLNLTDNQHTHPRNFNLLQS